MCLVLLFLGIDRKSAASVDRRCPQGGKRSEQLGKIFMLEELSPILIAYQDSLSFPITEIASPRGRLTSIGSIVPNPA